MNAQISPVTANTGLIIQRQVSLSNLIGNDTLHPQNKLEKRPHG